MKKLGIALIVIGLVVTIFTGVSFITKKKVLDIGKVEITKDEKHNANWSPYVGVGIIVLGGVILLFAKRGD
ncbi:MAG: hypothetical protein HC905_23105 [Bacteroidales bacterium]|nr:hypothetical protein [Bacteroidales bacterium]